MNTTSRSVAARIIAVALAALSVAPTSARADSLGITLSQPGSIDASAGRPETSDQLGTDALSSASTDPSTGAMRTSFAFNVPQARGKAQPQLALRYSSGAGKGVAGWGWDLDLPSIERKNESGPPKYQDPSIGATLDPSDPALSEKGEDQFVFGGQRLIPICFIEDGGACAKVSETMPAFARFGGWHYFRLENDSTFARFFWSPNHLTWLVQQKSGETWELGVPLDATDMGGVDADIHHGWIHNGPELAAPFRWNIVRKYDAQFDVKTSTHSNRVAYVWAPCSAGRAAVGCPTDVYDTPPAASPNAPFAAWAHHTRLSYEATADVSRPPMWRATPRARLTRVDVTSAPFKAGPARVLVRRYHLTYEEHQTRSYLRSVALEGRCASEISEDGSQHLPPTACLRQAPVTFDYTWPIPSFAPKQIVGTVPTKAIILDVNSDGVPDFVGPPDNPADNPKFQQLALNSTGLAVDTLGLHTTIRFSTPLYTTIWTSSTPPFSPDSGLSFTAGAFLGDGRLNVAWGFPGKYYAPGISGPSSLLTLWTPVSTSPTSWFWIQAGVATGARTQGSSHVNDPQPACEDSTVSLISDEFPVASADVDGDGYPDLLTMTGAGTVPQKKVGERVVYDANQQPIGVVPICGPAEIPNDLFVSLRATRRTRDNAVTVYSDYVDALRAKPLVSGLQTPAGGRYVNHVGYHDPASGRLMLDPGANTFFEDIDGDGLVDWVALRSSQLLYWPGQGDGGTGDCNGQQGFAEDCPNDFRTVARHVANVPPFSFRKNVRMHDLDGDGFSDIVVLLQEGVDVYFNQGGVRFDNRNHINASDIPAWDWNKTTVMFADMNGSGIDDIVFITDGYAAYADLLSGMTPGLLRSINNGHGATTAIEYASTVDLERCSRGITGLRGCGGPSDGLPWQTKMPQPLHVVSRITTRNNMPAPLSVHRVSDYSYSDPVIDPATMRFRGFKRVRSRVHGEPAAAADPAVTTETTFLVGQCQDDWSTSSCAGAQYDPKSFDALTGNPILVESYDDTKQYVSSIHSTYAVQRLLQGMDGRWVRSAYATQVDTLRYDTAAPQQAGGAQTITNATFDESSVVIFGSWRVRSAKTPTAHLLTSTRRDVNGNIYDTRDWGRAGHDAVVHVSTTWNRPQGDVSGWLWRPMTVHVDPFPTPQGGYADQPHDATLLYDSFGSLTSVTEALSGTATITRAAGQAPSPPGASVEGSKVRTKLVVRDSFGNPEQVRGPNDVSCVRLSYDDDFKQLPTAREVFTQPGCNGPALTTQQNYDRGWAVVKLAVATDGGQTTTEYDPFGRVAETHRPNATSGTPVSQASTTAQHIDADNSFVPGVAAMPDLVHTTTFDGTASRDAWTYLDGMGNTLATISSADPSAGDGGAWIVTGGTERSAQGMPRAAHQPFFWNGVASAYPVATGFSSPAKRTRYDAFGRAIETTNERGEIAEQRVYHALSVDTLDAENVAGHAREGAYVTTEKDGHGRTVRITKRARASGSFDNITTATLYTATGEIAGTVQTHTLDGGAVTRFIQYDSLGRMVGNREPNSYLAVLIQNGVLEARWLYAYDDEGHLVGTSDPRGCGENIGYDAAGRIVSEDYSPCAPTQWPYTTPLPDGTGTEVFYVYEGGALPSGRLAEVFDRAADTSFRYDARGRVTSTDRRLAQPGEPALALADRYATQTFRAVTEYDEADRVTTQSTGAEDGQVMAPGVVAPNGYSRISPRYSARGLVASVDSSYGMLVESATYDADGLLRSRRLSDASGLTQKFTPELPLRRLHETRLARSQPGTWPQHVLEDVVFKYDGVDNPLAADEQADPTTWKAGFKPRSRYFEYDDLYRVTSSTYGSSDDFASPFAYEEQHGDVTPLPATRATARVARQSFTYDWLGNTTTTTDDEGLFFDRSLGTTSHGGGLRGPHQMVSASLGGANGGSLSAQYDQAGNVTVVSLTRSGACLSPRGCNQTFHFDWDEVGQLAHAQRWDGPRPTATVDVTYSYDSHGTRVMRARSVDGGAAGYTAEVFATYRFTHASWNALGRDYTSAPENRAAYLTAGGVTARVFYSAAKGQRVLYELGDSLGSTSFVVDRVSGDVIERSSYQPYGATDSDFRADGWEGFRESYRFQSKEDDSEVGLLYFGARYFSPFMGRWLSLDPLNLHQLKGDTNPYAFVGGRVQKKIDPDGLDALNAMGQDNSGTDSFASTQSMQQGMAAAGYASSPAFMPIMPLGAMFQVQHPLDAFLDGFANTIPDVVNGFASLNAGKDTTVMAPFLDTHVDGPGGDRLAYELGHQAFIGLMTTGASLAAQAAKSAMAGGAVLSTSSAALDTVAAQGFSGAAESLEGGGMAAIRQLGTDGEAAANILKNTERIPSASGTAAYRIPDVLDHGAQVIGDVKNVARLSYTNQLRDFASYAQTNGYQFELTVRTTTQLSGPLASEVANGNILLRFLP